MEKDVLKLSVLINSETVFPKTTDWVEKEEFDYDDVDWSGMSMMCVEAKIPIDKIGFVLEDEDYSIVGFSRGLCYLPSPVQYENVKKVLWDFEGFAEYYVLRDEDDNPFFERLAEAKTELSPIRLILAQSMINAHVVHPHFPDYEILWIDSMNEFIIARCLGYSADSRNNPEPPTLSPSKPQQPKKRNKNSKHNKKH